MVACFAVTTQHAATVIAVAVTTTGIRGALLIDHAMAQVIGMLPRSACLAVVPECGWHAGAAQRSVAAAAGADSVAGARQASRVRHAAQSLVRMIARSA